MLSSLLLDQISNTISGHVFNYCHCLVYPHGRLFRRAVDFRKPCVIDMKDQRIKSVRYQSLEFCPIRVRLGRCLDKYGKLGDARAPFIAPGWKKTRLRACGSAILHGSPPSAVHAFSCLQEHFADTHHTPKHRVTSPQTFGWVIHHHPSFQHVLTSA